MRHAKVVGLGFLMALSGVGCANGAAVASPKAPATATATTQAEEAALASEDVGGTGASARATSPERGSGPWIGAAAEGEMLPESTRETALGVWVDVPEARPEVRPRMELALVVDTSGSMAGAKIENARKAAATLVTNLADGDIVALDAFSDNARTIVPPTRIDRQSRQDVLRAIAALGVSGSTNMFEGLTLAEGQVAAAPPTHPVRRIVLISDGIANVGPSTPAALGAIAERGLRFRTQVTSLGVGNDYDEHTLNALAVKSSGRLYHLTEPREMASILRSELDLLKATVASDAFIEVVPAAGVRLRGADGIRAEHQADGALRIPLGALHAGQHREALVRAQIVDPETYRGQSHALASVRLRFRDTRDADLERVQEVIARTQLTNDSVAIAAHVSSRTKAILAIQESAQIQMAAAQRINDGQFMDADKDLARAEAALAAQAQIVTAPAEKKRIADAQTRVAAARANAQALPSKPKAMQRLDALEMNASGMKSMGF